MFSCGQCRSRRRGSFGRPSCDRTRRSSSWRPVGAFAVGAFDGEELIAVGFVAPDGELGAWRVRGMATAPHARGRGAGTLVLEALLRHATTRGAQRIWCNARTPARSLYERAGLSVVSEAFEIPDIGPHYVMELTRGLTRATSGPDT
jgi:GNAT superfamily N-acetyltransferase